MSLEKVLEELNLEKVLDEVRQERAYQDEKWGGPDHDDSVETEESFIGYIAEYASGETERAARHDFRTRMVKVAALAVAAVERHDRLNQNPAKA